MNTTFSDQLEALERDVILASERRAAAWRRRQNEYSVSVEATADLTAYRDDVGYRKREPDPAEQRRLTRELCERVEREEGCPAVRRRRETRIQRDGVG